MGKSSPARYCIYGLSVESDVALPGLQYSTSNETDVKIVLEKVPTSLPDAERIGLRYQASRGSLLITVDGVARILVSGGERISVEPYPNVDEGTCRLFLLTAAIGALLHQREYQLLRGSCIEMNGAAVAFLGPSGVGKSLLAAALVLKGCRLVSDEYCVIRAGGTNERFIQPEYPFFKLWPDAIRQLGMAPTKYEVLRRGLAKRLFPVGSKFSKEAVAIRKVILLRTAPNSKIEITRLDAASVYSTLGSPTYLPAVLVGMGAEGTYRQMALSLAQDLHWVGVTRPRRNGVFAEFVERIEEELSA